MSYFISNYDVVTTYISPLAKEDYVQECITW